MLFLFYWFIRSRKGIELLRLSFNIIGLIFIFELSNEGFNSMKMSIRCQFGTSNQGVVMLSNLKIFR